jgi:hypothetical protein
MTKEIEIRGNHSPFLRLLACLAVASSGIRQAERLPYNRFLHPCSIREHLWLNNG